jgi:hypothetical protein
MNPNGAKNIACAPEVRRAASSSICVSLNLKKEFLFKKGQPACKHAGS